MHEKYVLNFPKLLLLREFYIRDSEGLELQLQLSES